MTEGSNVTHVDFSFLKSRGIHCLALWKASLWNWLLHDRANMPMVRRRTRSWPEWRRWLRILKPDTVVRWHRSAFARYWTWKSRRKTRATGGGCLDSRPDSTDDRIHLPRVFGSRHRLEREFVAPRSANYFEYYESSRTHLAVNKDAPVSRAVEGPANGSIVEVAQVGGLHHRYQRCAA